MERINPWESFQVKDYTKLMKEFGIEPFGKFSSKLPDAPAFIRRGAVFGHRDFERVYNAMKKKEKFVMLTGLMPSGKFHLGHMMVAEEIVYLQRMGAKVYLIVADIEAYNTRNQRMEDLRKLAIEEYLLNYIALGLKPRNCDFYFQSARSKDADKSNAYYRLAGMVPRRTTFNEMKAIYGELTPGKIVSVFHQVSDILHPQLREFEGPCPVIVPVGVDQDPHIRLTRDIASRMNGNREAEFILPSSFYHKFMPGLKGGKMSSSDPTSYIALTDDPETVKHKIMKHAFSGGANSIEEHRKHGGNPDIDVAYQILLYGLEPDDRKLKKIHDEYRSGSLLTGELKQYAIERVNSFLKKHQERMEKARDRIDRFWKVSSF